ncbi:carotenoid oxygenase family protein [Halobacterium rubrum]|uniref:carotenoid oxygenase family protein n=1 Tax=Halobacterium TaxID=2239 RepID=UPI001F1912CD|nr:MULTISPECIES: carotenoid oxygenase family protein [Halobacterium]MDH5020146.1 carotenoid oxygenase family protein [Halobacterium rubrum]
MPDYRVGFTSCETEHDDVELPVEGSLPGWLSGALLRNGPGKFEAGDSESHERPADTDDASFEHWFDGLAMLRRFAFPGDGTVRYSNRFLRTEEYRAVVDDGGLDAGQFGTGAAGSLLERLRATLLPEATDNTNVNVTLAGDSFLALTEAPERVAFDPETLETQGSWAFDDERSGHLACAHPVVDPDSGATFNLHVRFGRRPTYVVTKRAAGETAREVVARVRFSDAVYVHSFALTPEHVVVAACPLYVDVWGLLRPGGPSSFLDALDWRPDRPARFVVVSRDTGEVVAAPTAPAFFTFHHANAFRRGDSLVVDLVAFEDASVLGDLSLSALRAGSVTTLAGDLRRYRVPLDGDTASPGRATFQTLATGGLSLPRFDERRRGRPSRYVYATRTGDAEAAPNHPARVDCWRRETAVWREPGTFCGEPVFVPRPGGGEGDGVVLSVVLDPEREQSFLLVLDGETFAERARAWLPHVLPFDFHGQFYPDAALRTARGRP